MTLVRQVTIPEFQRFLARMVPDVTRALVRGLRAGALILQRTVVIEIGQTSPRPAVDTGELRNSVQYVQRPDGAAVTVDAPHAAAIENGTRPFTPPLQPLIDWVRRKGIGRMEGPAPRRGRRRWRSAQEASVINTARAIQMTIAKRGIAPRHYFARGWARALPLILAEADRELATLGYGRIRR